MAQSPSQSTYEGLSVRFATDESSPRLGSVSAASTVQSVEESVNRELMRARPSDARLPLTPVARDARAAGSPPSRGAGVAQLASGLTPEHKPVSTANPAGRYDAVPEPEHKPGSTANPAAPIEGDDTTLVEASPEPETKEERCRACRDRTWNVTDLLPPNMTAQHPSFPSFEESECPRICFNLCTCDPMCFVLGGTYSELGFGEKPDGSCLR